MSRFLDAPKALLPLWMVLAISTVATAAGGVVADAGAPSWAGVAVSALVCWPVAHWARLRLAARGTTGFEDLPSADLDYNDSPGLQFVAEMGLLVVLFGGGAAVGALVAAAGLGEGLVWGVFPVWLACGVLAAWPLGTEFDSRLGLWARRRRIDEEEAILAAAGAPRGAPSASPQPARMGLGSEAVVVGVNRRTGVLWCVLFLAFGGGMLLLGLLGDVSAIERFFLLIAAPFMLVALWRWQQLARAPWFLRLTDEGVDVLGAGPIPWSVVEAAGITRGPIGHSLLIWLSEPVEEQPWATPRLRRMSKGHGGGCVEATAKLADAHPGELLGALRTRGVEDVDVAIA